MARKNTSAEMEIGVRGAGALRPSGAQFEIAHGSQRAVVTEIGATLRAYTVGGCDVVNGFGEDEMCRNAAGQVLAPWPNRLAGGVYSFNGRTGRASLDEPEHGNAIHGLVRWERWSLVSRAQNYCTLSYRLAPCPAYAWWLDLVIEYRLGRRGLEVRLQAATPGREPAPFGIGFHPYFGAGGSTVDTCRLRVPADRVLTVDERQLPVGEALLSGGELDLRDGTLIGARRIDATYFGFGGAVGRSDGSFDAASLVVEGGRCVVVWMDPCFKYLQVFTADGDAFGNVAREAVAIEPMTCPPDGFNTKRDLITLEPGSVWKGRFGITPRGQGPD